MDTKPPKAGLLREFEPYVNELVEREFPGESIHVCPCDHGPGLFFVYDGGRQAYRPRCDPEKFTIEDACDVARVVCDHMKSQRCGDDD